jgi:hypothetical protein
MIRKIKFWIEDCNGHSELNVPEDKVPEEVQKQLEADKWVEVEKKNGETELLTEKDLPTNNILPTPEQQKEWAKKFKNVQSITSIHKTKGG